MSDMTTTSNQLNLFSHPARPALKRVQCPTCCGSGQVLEAEALAHMSGMVGKDHPETSKKAAKSPSNVLRFGTQRHRALQVLDTGSLTAAEVAARIGVSRNQTATRLLELHRAGLVRYLLADGQRVTRPTGPSDEGLVHEITAAGRAALGRVSG